MKKDLSVFFFSLVRLGTGNSATYDSADIPKPNPEDWEALKDLATQQGLLAVVLDGLDRLKAEGCSFEIPKKVRLEWIGEVLQKEQQFAVQQKTATEMALLLHHNGIKTYVLKGEVVSECYPKPEHRVSVDMDCFLASDNPDNVFDEVWEKGNHVIEVAGFEVSRGFYKNSSFHFPGLHVENHRFLTPFRGNKKLRALERVLQDMLLQDKGVDRFEGTWLYRPPVMVSALFLVEHAYSHFLHEGLTWRHILDWQMFSRRHKDEIDWSSLEAYIDKFGFRKFYVSYCRLGEYLIGNLADDGLQPIDRLMLTDVYAPLDLHKSLHGLKAKLQLAGNYWRARWKFKHFTDMTWVRALVEWGTGAVFDRHPTLNKRVMLL